MGLGEAAARETRGAVAVMARGEIGVVEANGRGTRGEGVAAAREERAVALLSRGLHAARVLG
jgi:hypothetical protein